MYNRIEKMAIDGMLAQVRQGMGSSISVNFHKNKKHWVDITIGLGDTYNFSDGNCAIAYLAGIKEHQILTKRLNEKAKGTFNEN